ncbi:hypothetical protein, partial [Metapseudomonas otitidis]|uniref:hypothetical protein n=1 Tax=Metapseudomonas otitidis TaxID=319939 RepID=UPI00197E669E
EATKRITPRYGSRITLHRYRDDRRASAHEELGWHQRANTAGSPEPQVTGQVDVQVEKGLGDVPGQVVIGGQPIKRFMQPIGCIGMQRLS